MIAAAELRRWFRFDRDAGTTSTSAGSHTKSESELCTRACTELAPTSDRRFAVLNARHPGAVFAIAMRYDSVVAGLEPGTDVAIAKDSRQAFDIVGAVDPTGMREEWHVALKERDVRQAA